jgi:opacity protein-like surface antigen
MKSLIKGCCAALAFTAVGALPQSASAGDIYVTAFGALGTAPDVGFSYLFPKIEGPIPVDMDMDSAVAFGATIGVTWNEVLRSEIELSHFSSSAKTINTPHFPFKRDAFGSVSGNYVLANVWLDWKNPSAFTPYAGGGAGTAFVSANGVGFSDVFDSLTGSDAAFAWQLGTGIKWATTDKLSLDVGYRLKGVTGLDFKTSFGGVGTPANGIDLLTHQVQAGLTYRF